MTKVTTNSFNKENKKFIYLKIKLKQNPKSDFFIFLFFFWIKDKYTRRETYVCKYPSEDKQNKSKTKFQQNDHLKCIISWETLLEKLKMTGRSRSKIKIKRKNRKRHKRKDLQHQLINVQRREITHSWNFINLKDNFHFSSNKEVREE